jgi:sigma-B regulation protein RsbU (phosphoserine phosphatase)
LLDRGIGSTIVRVSMTPESQVGAADVSQAVPPDDDSQRHLLAVHLLELETHSKVALQSAGVGIWSWEITSDILIWDEITHQLFGVKPGEFSERRQAMEKFIHPEDRRRVRTEVARCLRTGADFNSEYRVVWQHDSSVHYLRSRGKVYRDAHANPIRMTGACWDITERKTIEDELARERFLLRTLMEHIPDKIYFKDAASRFIWLSHETLARFGATDPAEILGKTDFDFFKEEHARQAFADEQKIIRTGEPLVNLEERETWADGRETWVSTTKMPLVDVNGKIIGTFGLSRDITEHKRAEEQLARYAEELRRKNQELEEDLEMARELQNALMPQRYPSFPRHASASESALRFAHFFSASTSVSGDFFDILPLSDTNAGIVICDVMGHGVRAALIAAIVRALIGELKSVALEPGEALERFNRKLFGILKQTRIPMFASAAYVVADVAGGEMRYANAGHPAPVWLHRRDPSHDGTTEAPSMTAGPRGPVLGIFEDARYLTTRCAISVDDMVLLFTDGVFEVESATGVLYDEHLLTEAIHRRRHLPAAELLTEVIAEVQQFSAEKHFADDVCLVALEIKKLGISPAPSGTP